MEQLLGNISILVNDKIYLKDPRSSDLGKRIITGCIDLIDELGFDEFTFRKLGQHIQSPEASIYRYFESKHKVLLYLTSWYWAWMEYKMAFYMANIDSPEERLIRAIRVLTSVPERDNSIAHIDEQKLHRIVVSESSKAFLTRNVDAENKEGVFLGYKQLVAKVAYVVSEIDPSYKYPHMLISTVIEGGHLQRYFSEHLPGLTDVHRDEDSITQFYTDLVFKCVENKKTAS